MSRSRRCRACCCRCQGCCPCHHRHLPWTQQLALSECRSQRSLQHQPCRCRHRSSARQRVNAVQVAAVAALRNAWSRDWEQLRSGRKPQQQGQSHAQVRERLSHAHRIEQESARAMQAMLLQRRHQMKTLHVRAAASVAAGKASQPAIGALPAGAAMREKPNPSRCRDQRPQRSQQ